MEPLCFGSLNCPGTTQPSSASFIGPSYTSAHETIKLTIDMATYNNFDVVYFTLEVLRLYQDLRNIELLVIGSYGSGDRKRPVENWVARRYVRATRPTGTPAPRDLVFREAQGEAVLRCHHHILSVPGAVGHRKQLYRDNPDCMGLLQGPLLLDDARTLATHFDPVRRDQVWGTWGLDPAARTRKPDPSRSHAEPGPL